MRTNGYPAGDLDGKLERAGTSLLKAYEIFMKTRVIKNAEAETGLEEATCAHQRLIDDIWTSGGKRTGKVRCLECSAVIDDPHRGQR